MGIVVVIALTFVVLAFATVAVGTSGRRRRGRRHEALAPARREALAHDVGWTLTEVVEDTRALRSRLETVLANGRDMLRLEDAVGGGRDARRPLWRQLEDASYERDLARADEGLRAWFVRIDALEGRDRQIFDEVAPSLSPVRALAGATWTQPPPGIDPRPGLKALQAGFEHASRVLEDLQGRLEAYQPRGYR